MCIQFKYEFFMQMQAQRNTNRHTKKKAIYIYVLPSTIHCQKRKPEEQNETTLTI